MNWIGERVRDVPVQDAYLQVQDSAEWSEWLPFSSGVTSAPRLPGVYLFRETVSQMIRYAGMAGERAGGGRPQGLHGRLNVYRTGKGAVSGFGEAALDRALSDVDWLQQQVDRVRVQGPRRAKQWAADAVERISPEISWAICHERFDARVLEDPGRPAVKTARCLEPVNGAAHAE